MTKIELKIDRMILSLRLNCNLNYKEWDRFELKEAQEGHPPPSYEKIISLLEECKNLLKVDCR